MSQNNPLWFRQCTLIFLRFAVAGYLMINVYKRPISLRVGTCILSFSLRDHHPFPRPQSTPWGAIGHVTRAELWPIRLGDEGKECNQPLRAFCAQILSYIIWLPIHHQAYWSAFWWCFIPTLCFLYFILYGLILLYGHGQNSVTHCLVLLQNENNERMFKLPRTNAKTAGTLVSSLYRRKKSYAEWKLNLCVQPSWLITLSDV